MQATMGMTIAMTMVLVSVDDDEVVAEEVELVLEEDAAGQMPLVLQEVWLVVQAEHDVQVVFTR